MARQSKYKVILRKDVDYEHLLVYKDGILIDDSIEGFPKINMEDALRALNKKGLFDLDIEKIE